MFVIFSDFGTSTACTYQCPGNNAQLCGGVWGISVYKIGKINLYNSATQIPTEFFPWTMLLNNCNVNAFINCHLLYYLTVQQSWDVEM